MARLWFGEPTLETPRPALEPLTLAVVMAELVDEVKPSAVMLKPLTFRVVWLLPLYLVRSNRPVRVSGMLVLMTETADMSPATGESSSTEMGRLPVVVVLPSDTVTPIWKLSTSSLPLTG